MCRFHSLTEELPASIHESLLHKPMKHLGEHFNSVIVSYEQKLMIIPHFYWNRDSYKTAASLLVPLASFILEG